MTLDLEEIKKLAVNKVEERIINQNRSLQYDLIFTFALAVHKLAQKNIPQAAELRDNLLKVLDEKFIVDKYFGTNKRKEKQHNIKQARQQEQMKSNFFESMQNKDEYYKKRKQIFIDRYSMSFIEVTKNDNYSILTRKRLKNKKTGKYLESEDEYLLKQHITRIVKSYNEEVKKALEAKIAEAIKANNPESEIIKLQNKLKKANATHQEKLKQSLRKLTAMQDRKIFSSVQSKIGSKVIKGIKENKSLMNSLSAHTLAFVDAFQVAAGSISGFNTKMDVVESFVFGLVKNKEKELGEIAEKTIKSKSKLSSIIDNLVIDKSLDIFLNAVIFKGMYNANEYLQTTVENLDNSPVFVQQAPVKEKKSNLEKKSDESILGLISKMKQGLARKSTLKKIKFGYNALNDFYSALSNPQSSPLSSGLETEVNFGNVLKDETVFYLLEMLKVTGDSLDNMQGLKLEEKCQEKWQKKRDEITQILQEVKKLESEIIELQKLFKEKTKQSNVLKKQVTLIDKKILDNNNSIKKQKIILNKYKLKIENKIKLHVTKKNLLQDNHKNKLVVLKKQKDSEIAKVFSDKKIAAKTIADKFRSLKISVNKKYDKIRKIGDQKLVKDLRDKDKMLMDKLIYAISYGSKTYGSKYWLNKNSKAEIRKIAQSVINRDLKALEGIKEDKLINRLSDIVNGFKKGKEDVIDNYHKKLLVIERQRKNELKIKENKLHYNSNILNLRTKLKNADSKIEAIKDKYSNETKKINKVMGENIKKIDNNIKKFKSELKSNTYIINIKKLTIEREKLKKTKSNIEHEIGRVAVSFENAVNKFNHSKNKLYMKGVKCLGSIKKLPTNGNLHLKSFQGMLGGIMGGFSSLDAVLKISSGIGRVLDNKNVEYEGGEAVLKFQNPVEKTIMPEKPDFTVIAKKKIYGVAVGEVCNLVLAPKMDLFSKWSIKIKSGIDHEAKMNKKRKSTLKQVANKRKTILKSDPNSKESFYKIAKIKFAKILNEINKIANLCSDSYGSLKTYMAEKVDKFVKRKKMTGKFERRTKLYELKDKKIVKGRKPMKKRQPG